MKPDTRPNFKRRPKPAPPPPVEGYPPGFFCELIREHRWPPMWQPQAWRSGPDFSAISTANREARQEKGETGTIVGLSARADMLIAQRRAHTRAGR